MNKYFRWLDDKINELQLGNLQLVNFLRDKPIICSELGTRLSLAKKCHKSHKETLEPLFKSLLLETVIQHVLLNVFLLILFNSFNRFKGVYFQN